ncbi:MAG: response regulator [Candidatus Omnitrophica bacterium]|nr:response regulator [Candidatus Omnitrophota bacterium]MCM8793751.1 response regulator [Candidatus Omnitrophota bacterium]
MSNRILLIEDEEDIRKTLEGILTREGFTVDFARDGLEAMQKLEEVSFNLIILDLMLPKWDGFKICKTIKQHKLYKDVPVIILTAMAQEEDRQKCLSYGVDEYIKKPFDPDFLIKRIKELLQKTPRKPITS